LILEQMVGVFGPGEIFALGSLIIGAMALFYAAV
jgi:hypothetical protein